MRVFIAEFEAWMRCIDGSGSKEIMPSPISTVAFMFWKDLYAELDFREIDSLQLDLMIVVCFFPVFVIFLSYCLTNVSLLLFQQVFSPMTMTNDEISLFKVGMLLLYYHNCCSHFNSCVVFSFIDASYSLFY